MRKFTFIWFVENFSYCWHKKGEKLESPTFYVKMMQQTAWKIILYPRGKEDRHFLSLFVERCCDSVIREKIALAHELSILYANGRALESTQIKEINVDYSRKGASFEIFDFYERPKSILKDKAFSLDTLRLCCTMWIGEGEVDKETICYAKTRIGLGKISFINVIENFSNLIPNEQIEFVSKSVSENALKLLGNVKVVSESGSGEVRVEISLKSQNAHLMKCQIYQLNSTGQEVECGRIDTRNKGIRALTSSTQINVKKKIVLMKNYEYFPDDKLTLRFECTLSTGIEIQRIEETFYDINLTPLLEERIGNTNFNLSTSEPKSVSGDFKSIYKDQIICDILLETKTKIFPAHKSVLCARSPFFADILKKEKFKNCIKIYDLEDNIIDQFLLFLYTDILEDLQWESATKLYVVAVKFQVQRLKNVCSLFLITGLNIHNMCEVLILAEKHEDTDLKKDVQKFFLGNHYKVFCTDEWETFMNSHPNLAMEAMWFYLRNNEDLSI